MLHDARRKYYRTLRVDGVPVGFFLAHEETKVSLLTFNTLVLFGSHEDSWATMVTSRTPKDSTLKEIYLLTSSHSFQRRTLSQGSTE